MSLTLAPKATPRPAHESPWIPPKEFLDDLPRLMRAVSLPGLTLAVVEEGEVAWTHAVGLSNVEDREPMRDESMFEAASMSKPIFAYVVMKLAEEGVIDLDRPLAQYLRPKDLSDHPDNDLVTARHVLSHSTGFPNWRANAEEERLSPKFTPGTGFSYSGEAFQWLQYVVEDLTGGGVDLVMRSRLFDPAGMPLSTFGWSAEAESLAVCAYHGPDGDNEGKLGPQYKRNHCARLGPLAAGLGKSISAMTDEEIRRVLPSAKGVTNVAGNLLTTAAEYARFMTLMMDSRDRAEWEISEESRRDMLSHWNTRKEGFLYWGIGWALEETPSGPLFYHTGNNCGIFKTLGIGDAARRKALVVLTNGGGGDSIFGCILRASTRLELVDFL